jgi:hypothetical protein
VIYYSYLFSNLCCLDILEINLIKNFHAQTFPASNSPSRVKLSFPVFPTAPCNRYLFLLPKPPQIRSSSSETLRRRDAARAMARTPPPPSRTPPTSPPQSRMRPAPPPQSRTSPTSSPQSRTHPAPPPQSRTPPTSPPQSRTRPAPPPSRTLPASPRGKGFHGCCITVAGGKGKALIAIAPDVYWVCFDVHL